MTRRELLEAFAAALGFVFAAPEEELHRAIKADPDRFARELEDHQRWPGVDLVLGNCPRCHSTICVHETPEVLAAIEAARPPERSVAA